MPNGTQKLVHIQAGSFLYSSGIIAIERESFINAVHYKLPVSRLKQMAEDEAAKEDDK